MRCHFAINSHKEEVAYTLCHQLEVISFVLAAVDWGRQDTAFEIRLGLVGVSWPSSTMEEERIMLIT